MPVRAGERLEEIILLVKKSCTRSRLQVNLCDMHVHHFRSRNGLLDSLETAPQLFLDFQWIWNGCVWVGRRLTTEKLSHQMSHSSVASFAVHAVTICETLNLFNQLMRCVRPWCTHTRDSSPVNGIGVHFKMGLMYIHSINLYRRRRRQYHAPSVDRKWIFLFRCTLLVGWRPTHSVCVCACKLYAHSLPLFRISSDWYPRAASTKLQNLKTFGAFACRCPRFVCIWTRW